MSGIWVLAATAASVGLVHTVLGPDHYLPFVVMARARKWTQGKTAWITLVCGLGHIGSSLLLGLAGVALGVAVSRLQAVESIRGNLAAWALIAFGLVYGAWGLRQAVRNRPHHHAHPHSDGHDHDHQHAHQGEHLHVHDQRDAASLTPWVLFTIFVFGPCEPLIPLVMYPAARHNIAGLVLVVAVFGTVTILTMLASVLSLVRGVQLLPAARFERYSHALAGLSIMLCGLAIQFLGL